MEESAFPNWFEYVKDNFVFLPQDIELSILQVGVFKGDCTRYLLDNYRVSKIVDVDTWAGSIVEYPDISQSFDEVEKIYDRKIAGDRRVMKKKMTSDLYFSYWAHGDKFDFVYIDGSHASPQVLKDGINGFEHLKVGGLLAFDDYQWPEYKGTLANPKIGIDCWLRLFAGRYDFVANNYQIWIKKRSES